MGNDEELEKERKNLLSGIFDSGIAESTNNGHQYNDDNDIDNDVLNGSSMQIDLTEHDDFMDNNNNDNNHNNNKNNNALLPVVKSCIDKHGGLLNLVENVDSNDEMDSNHHKKRHHSSKHKKHSSSSSKHKSSRSSSKHKSSSSKHHS